MNLVDLPFTVDLKNIDDVKRIQSSKEIQKKKIKIDFEKFEATIQGSGFYPYHVTLHSCDCVDASMRGIPCKHMIRLAIELGYDFDFPEFDPELAKSYDTQDDIERLHRRWRSGQLTTESYVACVIALKKSEKKAK